jgi:hypothetical protein
MKQFFFGLVACGLAAVLPAQAANVAAAKVAATVTSNTDKADSAPAAAGDPSLCLDSMETVPDDDDLVPTPVSVDGGCSVSTDTIST